MKYTDFSAFEAVISFNSTVLEPVEFVASGTGIRRSIRVEKPWNPADTIGVLSDIWFYTALGNSECSAVKIESFKWASNLRCDISTVDAGFCLEDVCKEGGLRLIDPHGAVQLRSIVPNPASDIACVELNIIEAGQTKIQLVNTTGETVRVLAEGELLPGCRFWRSMCGTLAQECILCRLSHRQ
jgi:hypothetical protein